LGEGEREGRRETYLCGVVGKVGAVSIEQEATGGREGERE